MSELKNLSPSRRAARWRHRLTSRVRFLASIAPTPCPARVEWSHVDEGRSWQRGLDVVPRPPKPGHDSSMRTGSSPTASALFMRATSRGRCARARINARGVEHHRQAAPRRSVALGRPPRLRDRPGLASPLCALMHAFCVHVGNRAGQSLNRCSRAACCRRASPPPLERSRSPGLTARKPASTGTAPPYRMALPGRARRKSN